MTQFTNRQEKICAFIAARGTAKNSGIVAFFASENEPLSRETAACETLKGVAKEITGASERVKTALKALGK